MLLKKSTIYFLLLVLLTSACSKKNTSKQTPSGIIKQEMMVDILVDIHIAESGIEHSGLHPDSLNQQYANYYQAIFQKYGVSKEKFLRSTSYYFENPSKFEVIYTKVTEKLDQLNAEKWN